MMSAASSVALTATLPVEVLMKSAPASIASSEARRIIAASFNLAGFQDDLQQVVAAFGAHGSDHVGHRLPLPAMNLR
jgi:hypothetical protein